MKGTAARDVKLLPAEVRDGEVLVVIHYLIVRRSLKGQCTSSASVPLYGRKARSCCPHDRLPYLQVDP
jgi:hypothetical protein